jgi:hypothetical protein
MTKRWSAKAFELTAFAMALSLFTVGCEGDDDDDDKGANNTPAVTHLELNGSWENKDFAETDVIDDASWTTAFGDGDPVTSSIETFDNDENYLVYSGPDGKYSRIVWTEIDGDSFYDCTVDFGLDTLDAALASEKTADDSDPDNAGCGGFPWTKLTRK